MGKKRNALLRSLKNHDASFKKLQDFTSNANWDEFYILRGVDDSFEWYAGSPQFEDLLVKNLMWLWNSPEPTEPPQLRVPEKVRILVPGCGSSNLSARLYDIGFRDIMNVDFSKFVIMNMMRRNLRERPAMKWSVNNMVVAKFTKESIDAIVDKGLLDALMDPILKPSGNLYLIQVKRVLSLGGIFICFTLAESHVIDLIFHKFRYGWKMRLHTIAKESVSAPQIFALVAEKQPPTFIYEISSFLDNYSVESHGEEACELFEALERERAIRINTDLTEFYPLGDLILGAKGNIRAYEPGRRIKLILGGPGVTIFTYSCVLFDANLSEEGFKNGYSVMVIPKVRLHSLLKSSEERMWKLVVSRKTARLLMVFLDSSNYIFPMVEIKKDLSRLVSSLAPEPVSILYCTADRGIRPSDRLYEVMSELTGPIIVEDVMYLCRNEDGTFNGPKYRRLIFSKTENLVQSEALLSTKEESSEAVKEAPKRKKKGKQQKSDSGSSTSQASSDEREVDLSLLASEYHNAIISGIHVISSYLSKYTLHGGDLVRTVVIGLGAGLLPMYMKNHLPTHTIEVVEIDPVILNIAKEFFGFKKDERLKVHIKDGIKFVKEMADSKPRKVANTRGRGKKKQVVQEESSSKVDILIVDANSSSIDSGLSCPGAGFIDESFLLAARGSLSERGVFIINLITRSSALRRGVYSRLKTVFSSILCLKIDGDFDEVLFALKTECPFEKEKLSQTRELLASSLEHEEGLDFSKPIEPLR